jgi:ABC transporter substrate binding protein
MDRERPDAILMVSDSLTLLNRRRVFEYAAERRLPAIYETDSLTREGGLMSYGPDRRELFERSAALLNRIFKGAKPADLPVEQPTRFLFMLNLKTAKAMELKYRTRCSHLPSGGAGLAFWRDTPGTRPEHRRPGRGMRVSGVLLALRIGALTLDMPVVSAQKERPRPAEARGFVGGSR